MTAKEVLRFIVDDYYRQLPNKYYIDEIEKLLNNWEELSYCYNSNIFNLLAQMMFQFETISRTFLKEDDLYINDYTYRFKVKDKIFEVDLEFYEGDEDGSGYDFDLQSFREVISN